MKQNLTTNDKKTILEGLKNGTYDVFALNHLSKYICDHSGESELFGDIKLPLTVNDKRKLLTSLQRGYIDFEELPDLKEKIKQNFFLELMKIATCDE
jgi:hypothetical protein